MEATPRDGPLTVQRLRIYPVKGARGRDVNRQDFDEIGPINDRRWMVVDGSGNFLSQRDNAKLATLPAGLEGSSLTLGEEGAELLTVPPVPGPPFQVRVWDSTVEAHAVSPEADEWVSSFLGSPVRLAFMPLSAIRETDARFAPGRRVSFADGYPVLVATTGSFEEVARRGGRAIPLERFRPNIVVSGGEPHEEDWWRRFQVGTLGFSGVKLCARCKVTTVDQDHGTLDPDSEPLRTLGRYRRIEGKVFFGLNAVHDGTGQIRVGDRVTVTERRIVPAF